MFQTASARGRVWLDESASTTPLEKIRRDGASELRADITSGEGFGAPTQPYPKNHEQSERGNASKTDATPR